MTIPKKHRRVIHSNGEECEYCVSETYKHKRIYIKGLQTNREVKLELYYFRYSITPKDVKDIYLDKMGWMNRYGWDFFYSSEGNGAYIYGNKRKVRE